MERQKLGNFVKLISARLKKNFNQNDDQKWKKAKKNRNRAKSWKSVVKKTRSVSVDRLLISRLEGLNCFLWNFVFVCINFRQQELRKNCIGPNYIPSHSWNHGKNHSDFVKCEVILRILFITLSATAYQLNDFKCKQ